MQPLRKTVERGYGAEHQRIRKATISSAYGTPCTRCGHPMELGQALDLDHLDDRSGYRGWSHSTCNRAAGARKVNNRRSKTQAVTSRDW